MQMPPLLFILIKININRIIKLDKMFKDIFNYPHDQHAHLSNFFKQFRPFFNFKKFLFYYFVMVFNLFFILIDFIASFPFRLE